MQLYAPLDELRLDNGWSIGEESFSALVDDLRGLAPQQLIEFGSGASSVRLAQAFPDTRIFAVESASEFYHETVGLRERHHIGERLTVELRPLAWQMRAGALYKSYRPGPFPGPVDAVIVDGPPGRTLRGREACLHMIIRQLRIGGRVYLDDYDRAEERQIVRNWKLCYRGVLTQSLIEKNHCICVLEKTRAVGRVRLSPRVVLDSGLQTLRLGARALRDVVQNNLK